MNCAKRHCSHRFCFSTLCNIIKRDWIPGNDDTASAFYDACTERLALHTVDVGSAGSRAQRNRPEATVGLVKSGTGTTESGREADKCFYALSDGRGGQLPLFRRRSSEKAKRMKREMNFNDVNVHNILCERTKTFCFHFQFL